jgi:hypothetical protein
MGRRPDRHRRPANPPHPPFDFSEDATLTALWGVHLIVDCGLSTADAISYAKTSGLGEFVPYVESYGPA